MNEDRNSHKAPSRRDFVTATAASPLLIDLVSGPAFAAAAPSQQERQIAMAQLLCVFGEIAKRPENLLTKYAACADGVLYELCEDNSLWQHTKGGRTQRILLREPVRMIVANNEYFVALCDSGQILLGKHRVLTDVGEAGLSVIDSNPGNKKIAISDTSVAILRSRSDANDYELLVQKNSAAWVSVEIDQVRDISAAGGTINVLTGTGLHQLSARGTDRVKIPWSETAVQSVQAHDGSYTTFITHDGGVYQFAADRPTEPEFEAYTYAPGILAAGLRGREFHYLSVGNRFITYSPDAIPPCRIEDDFDFELRRQRFGYIQSSDVPFGEEPIENEEVDWLALVDSVLILYGCAKAVYDADVFEIGLCAYAVYRDFSIFQPAFSIPTPQGSAAAGRGQQNERQGDGESRGSPADRPSSGSRPEPKSRPTPPAPGERGNSKSDHDNNSNGKKENRDKEKGKGRGEGKGEGKGNVNVAGGLMKVSAPNGGTIAEHSRFGILGGLRSMRGKMK